MSRTFRNILVLYKKSAYEVHFPGPQNAFRRKKSVSSDAKRFELTHHEHYRTLAIVERTLKEEGLRYEKRVRGRTVDYKKHSFVITVGGDGTFLEAARNLKDQLILGVNSDPGWSVGQFCQAKGAGFRPVLKKILHHTFRVKPVNRIRLEVDRQPKLDALNDILVCHRNPAAMSHYYLKVGGVKEEQRSSGLWIATAAGSSGAIKSAGGRNLPLTSKHIQYMPRELHRRLGRSLRLTGGVVALRTPIIVTSLMKDGFVYVDGAHLRVPLPFGLSARIIRSPHPLRMVSVR